MSRTELKQRLRETVCPEEFYTDAVVVYDIDQQRYSVTYATQDDLERIKIFYYKHLAEYTESSPRCANCIYHGAAETGLPRDIPEDQLYAVSEALQVYTEMLISLALKSTRLTPVFEACPEAFELTVK